MPHENFIGGAWKRRRGPAPPTTCSNPATGEVIAEVPSSDATDVDAAVAAAAEAFTSWGTTTPAGAQREAARPGRRRRGQPRRAQAARDDQRRQARLDHRLRVRPDRRQPAVLRRRRPHACRPRPPASTSRTTPRCCGATRSASCVGIAPWNYPLNMATWKLGPALAAGNTFILKPSELTPLTRPAAGRAGGRHLPARGLQRGVRARARPPATRWCATRTWRWCRSPATWSTGKLIARNAADSLKRVHLELGGKAPVVVFDDADLEAVVGCLAENGLLQLGPGLHGSVPGDRRPGASTTSWSASLGDAVGGLAVGDPTDRGHRGRAGGLGRAAGAGGRHGRPGRRRRAPRWSTGGARSSTAPASSTQPTVVAGPGPGRRDRAARGVRPGRQRPALRRRGAGPRLGQRRRLRPGRQRVDHATSAGPCACHGTCKFGTVWVNDHIPIVSEMPHGGFKQSGYGKDMSLYAIEHYTELKHVMVKSLSPGGPRSNSRGST